MKNNLMLERPALNLSPIYSEDPSLKEQWGAYLSLKEEEFSALSVRQAHCHLVSEANWLNRKDARSCVQLGVKAKIGDICYIDFGQAYLNEAGFQHFGVILSFCNGKAFVVPMTSNPQPIKWRMTRSNVERTPASDADRFDRRHEKRVGAVSERLQIHQYRPDYRRQSDDS